jgi:ubiquinone/menaquinone biosynthesis C-methylase UbiE
MPALYDFAQALAGGRQLSTMLSRELSPLGPDGLALDVGGGTGMYRSLLPPSWHYSCLDLDPQKLEGFRRKYPDDQAIEASACNIPCPDGSFDVGLMVAVSHHLTDSEFDKALAETTRVLKPTGMFLFVDAVWQPANLRGRFLWSLDRGSFPKTASDLKTMVAKHFFLEHEESWKVHHEYLLLRARPLGASNANTF